MSEGNMSTAFIKTPSHVHGIGYDRRLVHPNILHFGVGQFCRSHLFYYFHRLLQKTFNEQQNWGIIGVNVINNEVEESKWRDLKDQFGQYTLSLVPSNGPSDIHIVGSMLDFIHAPKERRKLMDYLIHPAIKIVSLTVTEGGYNIDEKTGLFDTKNPSVARDLKDPENPETVFGYIVEALRLRRINETGPFIVLSCDNLRHNGKIAKRAIVGYAREIDPSLAKWIERAVLFPNSMVDRITPATTEEKRHKLNQESKLQDKRPVIAEDFQQWVIEDVFPPSKRPPLEKVGVIWAKNVNEFEETKIRILNASHIMLAFIGLQLGHKYVHKSIKDPDINLLIQQMLSLDVLPTLKAPEEIDKEAYAKKVLTRFENSALKDQLQRIVYDGSSKIQVFWSKTILELLDKKMNHKRLAFGIACFLEMLKGSDEKGKPIPVCEPHLPETYKSLVLDPNPYTALKLQTFDIWRSFQEKKFGHSIVQYRKAIQSRGVRQTLQEVIKQPSKM